MSKASLAEKIAKLENSISKLQSEIEVRRSKLKKYQILLRELKSEKDKEYANMILQTILENGITNEDDRAELLLEIEKFAAQNKKHTFEKMTDSE